MERGRARADKEKKARASFHLVLAGILPARRITFRPTKSALTLTLTLTLTHNHNLNLNLRRAKQPEALPEVNGATGTNPT
jgi:hypothetical protein